MGGCVRRISPRHIGREQTVNFLDGMIVTSFMASIRAWVLHTWAAARGARATAATAAKAAEIFMVGWRGVVAVKLCGCGWGVQVREFEMRYCGSN